ncbi:VanZ family protein [Aneurinibacillus tyrosinisolvens]|uniref:VanZ family protein n=1 Tax=Aneurinibacillus tyrosinisolvens TaxID=1443435 RepID=UPI00063EE41A|nr:VanZ family protein [Aneurinibacillus tyrosinisolvens]
MAGKISRVQRGRTFLLYWIPLLLLIGGIFFSSSQPYQKQDIRPEIRKYINEKEIAQRFAEVKFTYVHGEVSVNQLGAAGFIEFFIRKGAHFTLYFLLGFLMYGALRGSGVGRGKRLVGSLLFMVLYAASDEIHQMYTANRTPLAADVLLDSVGGAIGIGAALVMKEIFS